jgi:hypothetical protein
LVGGFQSYKFVVKVSWCRRYQSGGSFKRWG